MIYAVAGNGESWRDCTPQDGEEVFLYPGEYTVNEMPNDFELFRPAEERSWRDAKIEEIKWLRERHRDEVALGVTTAITTEKYLELLQYIQSLRDWPDQPRFPNEAFRPTPPVWLNEVMSI